MAGRKIYPRDLMLWIMSLLFVGIGVWLLMEQMEPTIVAFFIAFSGATLVYQFLGGIDPETSFAGKIMGKNIEAKGSLAAVIIFWSVLFFTMGNNGNGFDITVSPSASTWVAIDKETGEPVEVEIYTNPNREDLIKINKLAGGISNIELQIENEEDTLYYVSPEIEPEYKFGKLSMEDIQSQILNFDLDKLVKVNPILGYVHLKPSQEFAFQGDAYRSWIVRYDGTELVHGIPTKKCRLSHYYPQGAPVSDRTVDFEKEFSLESRHGTVFNFEGAQYAFFCAYTSVDTVSAGFVLSKVDKQSL